MKQFVIVLAMETDKLIIVDKSTRDIVSNVYRYEPITSCDSLEEVTRLKDHIEEIGIQAYFDEVVTSAKKTRCFLFWLHLHPFYGILGS